MVNATRIAGLLGFMGVLCGAFGAHILETKVSARSLEIWHTAVLYNLIHAAACLWASQRSSSLAVWLWTAGVALFSGSLYFYALFGTHWLVFLTPIGGMFFLAGWLTVIVKPKS